MNDFSRLKDCVVTNKNVIVRVDINVPIKDGKIQDDARMEDAAQRIGRFLENNCKEEN